MINFNFGDFVVYIVKVLNYYKVLYFYVIEWRLEFYGEVLIEDVMLLIWKVFNGLFIVGGGFIWVMRNDVIVSGRVDFIV